MVDRPSGLEHFKEKLKIRHTPKPEKGISVKIKKVNVPESFFESLMKTSKEDVDENDDEEEENKSDEDKNAPKKMNPKVPPKIIDKSSTYALDRDLVMKSIRDGKRRKILEKTSRKEDAVLVSSEKADAKETELVLKKKQI